MRKNLDFELFQKFKKKTHRISESRRFRREVRYAHSSTSNFNKQFSSPLQEDSDPNLLDPYKLYFSNFFQSPDLHFVQLCSNSKNLAERKRNNAPSE
ncbi:hypothetical protein BpHYR1_045956 [Brachionus plicatilis]|uniref:Uncharacterized protein n=1 Tax=Brachionus plicatilis TaxID=10195 RepID=A0A3M7T6J2_BRAPC|nr:hypothetical protein BpHYR1_045956 [Brachionus plicatilis]